MKRFAILLAVAVHAALPLRAFDPPRGTAGPITVTVADPGEIVALGEPVAFSVTLSNAGGKPIAGELRIGVIDDWTVEDEAVRSFKLGPKATQTLPIRIIPGKASHAALYPVHARAVFRVADEPELTAHAVLIAAVAEKAVAGRTDKNEPASLVAPARGSLRLDKAAAFRVSVAVNGSKPRQLPVRWQGSDAATGASVRVAPFDAGELKPSIAVHPPYRDGWGEVWLDYRLKLPAGAPAAIEVFTALRNSQGNEPLSDGVEFVVLVDEGAGFTRLFERFTSAKKWEPARVDLSRFAGRQITLRLAAGSGPAHNTVVDAGHWGEPILLTGEERVPESGSELEARRKRAILAAVAAMNGTAGEWAWQLSAGGSVGGAALVPGPGGLADAMIAFASGAHHVVFEGFEIAIDGERLGANRGEFAPEKVEKQFADGRGSIVHHLARGGLSLPVRASFWSEKGALRVAFAMPGVKRDTRGEPRFTRLAIGPASLRARRVYAGLGNVLENPGRFELRAGGFDLSTRHAGVEFPDGLALVQAVDLFPDSLLVDPESQRYALVTHHDATFSFIPSAQGAFAAARAYRELAGFQPAPGVARLAGRMCLDQWGGDYRAAAEGIEKAARYGLLDAVFVKHDWQHWGYDYRLPEIFPPRGNIEDFRAMAEACKRHGILFAPHDNYIDSYPDAAGFSYDRILFNEDGTPQKAWFNKSRAAQSYRWLPTAFFPEMEENLQLIRSSFAPTSYFVDVFSAIAPMDFRDRQGRFFPKTVTTERWGAAFDRIREVLDGAPTISEAGHDALIGHLDGAQSDHSGWLPHVEREGHGVNFRWKMAASDGERVPWHDIASHGSFVLFAGGLGPRYAGGADAFLHGYASDDYLSLTVLGGRNPMCDGPFNRRAVMTYWLLHDLCAELGRRPMASHAFAGDHIHRQIVRFGEDARVTVNRGATDWIVDGLTLPRFGFVAEAGEHRASIARRNGVITAFTAGPDILFADARPLHRELPKAAETMHRDRLNADGRMIDFGGVTTNGAFRLRHQGDAWELTPLPGSLPFKVALELVRLGAGERRVKAVRAITMNDEPAGEVAFEQEGTSLTFETQPDVFSYLINFN